MTDLMEKIVFLALAAVSGMAVANHAVSNTRVTNPANRHQYFLTDVLSWQEAQAVARAAGGDLVAIDGAQENAWLVATFVSEKVDFLWIGLNDVAVEGRFEWTNGQPVIYTNWAAGEPNDNPARGGEDFGALNGPANPFKRPVGTWTDAPTAAKLRGIVEIPVQKE